MAAFLALVRRDLALALRAGGGAGLGVVFFLAVVVVTPFAIGPDLALLARVGPAILWIGALLASLIGLDRLFAADAEDGSLDLLFMQELPLELAAAAKGLAHWLATGLPLVVAAPLLALLLNIEPRATGALVLTLLAGTPAITFLGLIGAAFASAFRRGGLLVAVLVMPLAIPVLIFGVAATTAAITGPVPFGTPFRILLGLALGALVLGPVAAAAALRVARG
ncbi:heme exporter protein CcmB [Ancylobacter lacus]|uniref:heme exporter protein CcmB n=1 Tax=Ancylobacter lacus TaxID=2579970 RepID=UPI001BCC1452|nr:heme exporter protein CcmB [Ancylobacter lacus]MBS7538338.1 heme exporter protein CcmB [Ancylobacter lacus]